MILAVRDQEHDARRAAIRPIHGDRLAHGIADPRPAARHRPDIDIAQHQPEKAIVGRQRRLDSRAPGKHHQADALAIHAFQQFIDLRLCPREAIGCRVLRQHALRHVQNDHDIGRDVARQHLRSHLRLRPHEGQHAKRQGQRKQRQFGDTPRAGLTPGQTRLHRQGHEPRKGFAGAQLEIRGGDDHRQDRPREMNPVGRGEIHQGNLANSAPRPSQPTASSARANASGSANNSSYWRNRSSVMRVRSRRSISA